MTGNIIDRFEVKGRAALEYGASGTVVVFQHSPELRLPNSGDPVLLVRSDGWLYSGKAESRAISLLVNEALALAMTARTLAS